MTFFKFLQGIGDKLGILETVSTSESVQTTRIQTRTVSLRELTIEIRSGEIRVLADSPAELLIPFEKIFEAAGISSKPEDWTIERLKNILASESCKGKPRESVQKTVLQTLASAGIPAEALVKDAMARDQALDSFESRVSERMRERKQSCNNRLLQIGLQIQCLQEEDAKVRESLKADEDKWREWRRQKRAQERELALLASYIVDRPIITTDDEE
jgi:hypothetical protein